MKRSAQPFPSGARNALASAADPAPRIDLSDQAVFVMDDTAPAQVVTERGRRAGAVDVPDRRGGLAPAFRDQLDASHDGRRRVDAKRDVVM